MTQNYHTPLTIGAPANAATVNNPLAQLDSAIAGLATNTALLDYVLSTGGPITQANGAASAAQKVVTVDSTTGFLGGCYVEYALATGVIERNVVDTVDSGTQLTFTTNIGAGGIANNALLAVIPATLYQTRLTFLHAAYCFGDSLSIDGRYDVQLQTELGATWTVISAGVGGNTTTQMVARLATDVTNAGDAEYVVVLGGINDVLADVAAATIETNLQTIYTAIAAAGAKVVAVTITPFKTHASWTAGRQTVVDTVNTWILNTATDVDYAIDGYDALEEGTTDTLQAAYDSGDHLHLSTAGYAALGTAIYNGATWTAAHDYSTLTLSGDISLNQNLRNIDDVTFGTVTAQDRLDADIWRARTDDATLEIQNQAGAELLQIATGSDALYLIGDVFFRKTSGAGNMNGYYNGDTAYTCSTMGFSRSRGTYTAPTVVTEGDALGGIGFIGCVGAGYNYQTAATLKCNAGTVVGNTSVDGAVYLDIIVGGAEVRVLDATAGGVVFNQSGNAAQDFRIESDGDQFALYVDAGANSIAIGGAATTKVGFYGVAPIAQAVLATGTGASVDNVITALQNLGLVKQS